MCVCVCESSTRLCHGAQAQGLDEYDPIEFFGVLSEKMSQARATRPQGHVHDTSPTRPRETRPRHVPDTRRQVSMSPDFLGRDVNSGFSGGEKKRNEILQLALLEPSLAILDEARYIIVLYRHPR